MLRPLIFLSLVTTIAAMASCGGDDSVSVTSNSTSASASSGGGVTAEEACAQVATAICGKINSCSSFFTSVQFGDEATCEARLNLTCPSTFTAEGATVTPDIGKACADAIAGASCDDVLGRNLPAECKPTPGTLEDGAACGVDAQCKSTHCAKKGEVCGVCAAPVAAGGTCVVSEDCEDGLGCAATKCVALAGQGATCDDATPCKPTLTCFMGKCSTPAGAGEACDPVAQNCDRLQGLGCSGASVCQKLKLAGPGEVCGKSGGDLIICSGNGTCKDPGGGSGTCLAAAKDGQACDEMAGPKCLSQAMCSNGVCTLTDPASCK